MDAGESRTVSVSVGQGDKRDAHRGRGHRHGVKRGEGVDFALGDKPLRACEANDVVVERGGGHGQDGVGHLFSLFQGFGDLGEVVYSSSAVKYWQYSGVLMSSVDMVRPFPLRV